MCNSFIARVERTVKKENPIHYNIILHTYKYMLIIRVWVYFSGFGKTLCVSWRGRGGQCCKYKLHSWKPRNATVKETIFKGGAVDGGERTGDFNKKTSGKRYWATVCCEYDLWNSDKRNCSYIWTLKEIYEKRTK